MRIFFGLNYRVGFVQPGKNVWIFLERPVYLRLLNTYGEVVYQINVSGRPNIGDPSPEIDLLRGLIISFAGNIRTDQIANTSAVCLCIFHDADPLEIASFGRLYTETRTV